MIKCFFIFLFCFFFIQGAHAKKGEDTFPILLNKDDRTSYGKHFTDDKMFMFGGPSVSANHEPLISKQVTKDVKYSDVVDLVKKFNKELCEINKNGGYEVWFTFTGSAGVVVSASVGTGIKAIINCSE